MPVLNRIRRSEEIASHRRVATQMLPPRPKHGSTRWVTPVFSEEANTTRSTAASVRRSSFAGRDVFVPVQLTQSPPSAASTGSRLCAALQVSKSRAQNLKVKTSPLPGSAKPHKSDPNHCSRKRAQPAAMPPFAMESVNSSCLLAKMRRICNSSTSNQTLEKHTISPHPGRKLSDRFAQSWRPGSQLCPKITSKPTMGMSNAQFDSHRFQRVQTGSICMKPAQPWMSFERTGGNAKSRPFFVESDPHGELESSFIEIC